jgi:hypothetical protein
VGKISTTSYADTLGISGEAGSSKAAGVYDEAGVKKRSVNHGATDQNHEETRKEANTQVSLHPFYPT